MSDEIARGVINIEARDEGALASLRRVEAQFDRTMADIDRQEAEVRIKADIREFDRELERAKRELRVLKGEKASVEIDADTDELDKKIIQAEKDVKFLDGMKATIEIEVQGEKDVIAAQKEIAALEEKRAAAEKKRNADNMRALQQEARRRKSLSDQMVREMASDEAAARRMNAQRDKAATQTQREAVEVAKLHREYARLTDRIEAIDKRHAFTREARMKLNLDAADAVAKFELVKAELSRRGAHPPVDIRIDTRRSDMNRLQRVGSGIMGTLAKIAQGAAGISTMTIRLGPFTATIKQAVIALAMFGPVITDLLAGATSLIGVLGTGLAGALSVTAGLGMGLITNFGGIAASLHPMVADFKTAHTAINAYNTAVLKHGKNSKEAKNAEDQMNTALKGINPNARQAAKGLADMGKTWRHLTQEATQKDVGSTLTHGFKMMDAIMPTIARNSRTSMHIISQSLNSVFDSIARNTKTQAGGGILGSLGRSANTFLAPTLAGLAHLGAALAHVGEAAARIFAGAAGGGFERWAAGIDRATQPSEHLDDSIRRIGNHAKDVGRLFMDVGRLIGTVLNGSADAGDNLVNQLDHAIRSYDRFLSSTEGQKSMHDFFQRAADGVSSLAGALGPLLGSFVAWSNALSPLTRGILDAISFFSRLILKVTEFANLGGVLGAMGATFASLWAVGKISAFVAMLARVASLMKEAAMAGGVLRGLKLFGGGIGGALKGPAAGMAEGGTVAAARIEAGMVAGGNAAAARIGAAMTAGGARGGAVAGAEGLASRGGVILPAGAARQVEQTGMAAERSAGRLRSAGRAAASFAGGLVGISGPAAAVVVGVGAIAAGVYGLVHALNSGNRKAWERIGDLNKTVIAGQTGIARSNARYMEARDALGEYGSAVAHANYNVRDARKALDGTRKGTEEYKRALLDLHDAERQRIQDRKAFFETRDAMNTAAKNQVQNANAAVTANNKEVESLKARRKELQERAATGMDPGAEVELKRVNRELAIAQGRTAALGETQNAAWNRMAALPAQAARGIKGFAALTGAAEQAVGRLARTAGGKSIATKISVKYDDPNKAGRVATKARAALQSGVGKGAVMRIIADSRNADQAIRRLQAARITPKKLMILESGGKAAVRVLEQIIGRRLTRKEQRIAQAGGPAVLSLLERIVGKRLPGKTQRLGQAGGEAVLNIMDRIHGKQLGSAIKRIGQSGGESVLSIMDQIRGMELGTSVKNIVIRTTHKGHAEGGIEDPTMARAYERAASKAPVITRGGTYRTPTYIVGEEDKTEYIIATNPAYRRRNQQYLRMAAGEIGMEVVEAAKKGKKPPKKHGGPRAPHAATLPHVSNDSVTSDYINTWKQNADSSLNSARDKVNADNKKLDTKARAWKHARTRAAQQKIEDDVRVIKRDRAKWQSRIPSLEADQREAKRYYDEYGNLQNRVKSDTSIMNRDATTYNHTGDPTALREWNEKKSDRETALNRIQALLTEVLGKAGPRFQTDIQAGIDAAGDDIASSVFEGGPEGPAAATFDTFIDSVAGARDRLSALERDYALSQVNDVPDDPSTIYQNENIASLADNLSSANALADFFSGLLGTAQSSGQPAGIITEAANAYVSARDQARQINDTISSPDGTTTTVGAQMMALSTARQELYSTFGSNLAPVWTQPGSFPSAGSPFPAPGAYGQNPSSTSQPAGTYVTVNNSFEQPPEDPHTWSQGVAWELQAAV